ncbi:MAG TPA: hypothetical protein PKM28_06900, partial [Tenuifilaceae bacterium]|nr:hypothetical protein [Tenuifilaceae bacterium]
YKLDKTFGPVGTIAGVTIFMVGIYVLFYSFAGIALILLGAFVGFTGTLVHIDFDNRKLKLSTNLFGIFSVGNWIPISSGMKLGIKKTNLAWRTYSKGNRTLDTADKNYRIYLFESKKEVIPLFKAETLEKVNAEIEKLSLGLHIEKL